MIRLRCLHILQLDNVKMTRSKLNQINIIFKFLLCFLYINIMALKVLIVTISILAFLMFVRYTEETKENFITNIKQKKEHFENVSIQNVHADNNEVSEENSNEQENINSVEISDGEEENNNREQENNNGEQNSLEANNTEQCNGEKPKGDCLFGCDDNGVSQYTNDEKETKPANLEDMMKTFEETEKICEVIERKDKERRDREAVENLEKQLELNKKFLVQQKATKISK